MIVIETRLRETLFKTFRPSLVGRLSGTPLGCGDIYVSNVSRAVGVDLLVNFDKVKNWNTEIGRPNVNDGETLGQSDVKDDASRSLETRNGVPEFLFVGALFLGYDPCSTSAVI